MKIISDEQFEVHLSSDFFNPVFNTEGHRLYESKIIALYILAIPRFESVYKFSHPSLRTDKLLMLWAHGVGKENSSDYWFLDDGEDYSVQQWIDDHDGQGSAIIVFACNVVGSRLTSNKSLIFYPTKEISYNDVVAGRYMQMYIPT